jgi:hypothetical protein
MASAASWLGRFFRALMVQANGVTMPARDSVNFVGFTVTDNAGNNSSDVTSAPTLFAVTGNYAIVSTAVDIRVGISALGADATITFPANPAPGTRITLSIEDASLAAHNVIANGNGKTVTGPDASAGTYTIRKEDWGTGTVSGPALTFAFNGTLWKVD